MAQDDHAVCVDLLADGVSELEQAVVGDDLVVRPCGAEDAPLIGALDADPAVIDPEQLLAEERSCSKCLTVDLLNGMLHPTPALEPGRSYSQLANLKIILLVK